MAIKAYRQTTKDVAGWRNLTPSKKRKLEEEYFNTPEGKDFLKRNPYKAGNTALWQYKLDEAVNRYYDRGGQAYAQGSKAAQAKVSQSNTPKTSGKSSRSTSPNYNTLGDAMAAGLSTLSEVFGGNKAKEAGRQYRGQLKVDKAARPGIQYTFSDNKGNMRSPNREAVTPKGMPKGVSGNKPGQFTGTGQYYDFRDRSGNTPVDARTGRNTGQDAVGRRYGSPNKQTGGYTGRGQSVNMQAQHQYNSNMARANASTATQYNNARRLNMPGIVAAAANPLNIAAGLGFGVAQGQLLRTALETGQHIGEDPYLRGGQYDHNGQWRNNYGDENTAPFWNYRLESKDGKSYTDFGSILRNGHLVQAPNGEIQYYLGDPKQLNSGGGFGAGMSARMAKRVLTPEQAQEIWDSPYRKYIPESMLPGITKLLPPTVDRGNLPEVVITRGKDKGNNKPIPKQRPKMPTMAPIPMPTIGYLEPNKNALYNPNYTDVGVGNLQNGDIDGNLPLPIRLTTPYIGQGGLSGMQESLRNVMQYYPQGYNPAQYNPYEDPNLLLN